LFANVVEASAGRFVEVLRATSKSVVLESDAGVELEVL